MGDHRACGEDGREKKMVEKSEALCCSDLYVYMKFVHE
jgi:hypothetical protein